MPTCSGNVKVNNVSSYEQQKDANTFDVELPKHKKIIPQVATGHGFITQGRQNVQIQRLFHFERTFVTFACKDNHLSNAYFWGGANDSDGLKQAAPHVVNRLRHSPRRKVR